MPISALLIVLNNLKTLPDCLASLDWADDIIVVDGGSTDGTLDYLRGFDGRVDLVEAPWPGHFGKQRQVSFDNAQCGDDVWWCRIDSDEVMPALFGDNIRRLLESLPPEIVAARIKQYNLIGGSKTYSAGNGGFETHARMWRADRNLKWVNQVHEFVCRLQDGALVPIPEAETASLNLGIIHMGWLDEEAMEKKEAQYMSIPGSGFEEKGSLTRRKHVVREVPKCLTKRPL